MIGYSRCLIGLLPHAYECDYDWVTADWVSIFPILFDEIREKSCLVYANTSHGSGPKNSMAPYAQWAAV